MINEFWLGAACLIALISLVRASLSDKSWQALIHASLVGAWVWLSYGFVINWNLAEVYSVFARPDGLVLLLPVTESIVAIRASLAMAGPNFKPNRLQGLLALFPPLSFLAALLLLQAHVFQLSTSLDFDALGALLALSALAIFFIIPTLLRRLLPERIWRIELHLLLRAVLLISVFVGYAFTTMTPTPAPDASFSWKGAGLVILGIAAVATMGALLNDKLVKLFRVLKTRSQ